MLRDFCRSSEEWLLAGPNNVIVVHCKAGKGRTGSMICALLVYSGAVKSAYDALKWYEWTRGGHHSGVTIPAQIRWVAMLERWQRMGAAGLSSDPMGTVVPHRLCSIRFGPICLRPPGEKAACDKHPIAVRVGLATRAAVAAHTVSWWHHHTATPIDSSDEVEIAIPSTAPIWNERDGMLLLHMRPDVRAGARALGCSSSRHGWTKLRVWWHQSYLHAGCEDSQGKPQRLVLQVQKAWIDGVHRDLEDHEIVPINFMITATFETIACHDTIVEENTRHDRLLTTDTCEDAAPRSSSKNTVLSI
jgi:hypothetical protein